MYISDLLLMTYIVHQWYNGLTAFAVNQKVHDVSLSGAMQTFWYECNHECVYIQEHIHL